MAAGKLTADQLVHGQPGMFDHLQDRIVEMLEWVQSQLVERGYAEQIVPFLHLPVHVTVTAPTEAIGSGT